MRRLLSPTTTRTGAETIIDARRCAAVSDAIVASGAHVLTGRETGARESDASAPTISSRATARSSVCPEKPPAIVM